MSLGTPTQPAATVVIRLASKTDATALAGLGASFRDHLKAGSPSDAALRRDLPDALSDPSLEFACAWLGTAPVGYTQTRFVRSLWSGGTDAYLEDLFVGAEVRGRSIGRALLRHALSRARARGAKRFSLNTNEGNASAQALYRAEGLEPESHALYPDGREVLWVRTLQKLC